MQLIVVLGTFTIFIYGFLRFLLSLAVIPFCEKEFYLKINGIQIPTYPPGINDHTKKNQQF
jgi:hypothetical protein